MAAECEQLLDAAAQARGCGPAGRSRSQILSAARQTAFFVEQNWWRLFMSVDDSKSSFPHMWFYNPDGLRSTAGWSFQRGEAAGGGQEQPDIIAVSLSRAAELTQQGQGAAEQGRAELRVC